jgi:TfoX/Sxy family transcriptional regulator of competence genes
MAYDEHLGERISAVLKEKRVRYETKNMIGGLCFMVNDKMAVGVVNNSLLARIDPGIYQSSLKKKGCRPMDFTGRVMKGFVCVDPAGIDSEKDLECWIQQCLDFNPKAKSSKKPAATTKAKRTARKGKKSK